MGEGILLAHVEGNAEWLNVLHTIVEDTFSEGARAWFRLKGLMVTALLTLETSDLLKENSHGQMKVAFALAEPGLDRGRYDRRSLADSAGYVQYPGHLGHASVDALHLLLEIPLRRRFLSGGIPMGGVVLGIEASIAGCGE
ncbi:hypothetical protein L3X38_032026 [Prunus dulcis]|uniref:Uncharacterized protein n=1 Tax=Prunus dulcis TaxID=3755 RepID=A0AAD4VEQ6_PRUDU|nr:hypothetical protein L3X38_032026 [Prunus dulcis]